MSDISEKVQGILEGYRDDPLMLDAFWQWATASFSRVGQGKHAWAEERAYVFFLDNLSLRYGINDIQAKAIGMRLEEACSTLVEGNVYEAKKAVAAALNGDLGERHRAEIRRKTDEASLSARCLLASYNLLLSLPRHQYSVASYLNDGSGALGAVIRAVLGGLPGSQVKPFQEARDELVRCGVFNKSFYESSSGATSHEEFLPGLLLPEVSSVPFTSLLDESDVARYVNALFADRSFEQARILEEVAQEWVVTYDGIQAALLPGEVVPHQGLFAYINLNQGKLAAINPFGRDMILKHMTEVKAGRTTEFTLSLSDAFRKLWEDSWPDAELIGLKNEADRKIWRFSQLNPQHLFIFAGNWISQSDLAQLRELGANLIQDSFLFIVTSQTLPSLKRVIDSSLKMWQTPSIAVILVTEGSPLLRQLQGQPHQSVGRIFELLGGATLAPPPPPIKYRIEIRVIDDSGAHLSGAEVNIASISAITPEDGRTVFEISAGTHTITVKADGYEPSSEPVTIARNEQKTVQLRRTAEKKFTATVSVKDRDSQPLEGALVNFDSSISVNTGPSGTARVNLKTGKHEIHVSLAGFAPASGTVEMTRDITREFILESSSTGSLGIFLGNSREHERICWEPDKLNNGHLVIVGGSGAGKTELIRCIAIELMAHRFPVLMIDFHGDMKPSNAAVHTYDIKEGGQYYFNPLELNPKFPDITPLRAKSDFLDAISINFPSLGIQQKDRLADIIADGYVRSGITNDQKTWSSELLFTTVEEAIEGSNDKEVQSLRAYLRDIFEYQLFSGENKVSTSEVLSAGITHINLSQLPESLRSLYADLFLRKVYYSLQTLGGIPRVNVSDTQRFRIFVIVDEAKLLVSEKQGAKAVINKYASEMRKFGVGLVLASQMISHFNDEILANIAAKICMNAENNDQAKSNGRLFGIDPEVLLNLKAGQCFMRTLEGQVELMVVPSWERSGA